LPPSPPAPSAPILVVPTSRPPTSTPPAPRVAEGGAALELLRTVGMACFVNCFEDFEREFRGQAPRYATKQAVAARGGAASVNSTNTKAAVGVRIFREGLAGEALAAVCGSARVEPEVRAKAERLLASLRELR